MLYNYMKNFCNLIGLEQWLNKAVREGVITSTVSLNKCAVILSSPKDLLVFRWQIVSDSELPGTGSKEHQYGRRPSPEGHVESSLGHFLPMLTKKEWRTVHFIHSFISFLFCL